MKLFFVIFIYCSRNAAHKRLMSSPSFSPVHTLSFVYSQLWVCFTTRTQRSQIIDEIAFSFEFVYEKPEIELKSKSKLYKIVFRIWHT